MIPLDLETPLRPLERFEAIRRHVVHLGNRLCDLSYANPYQGLEERTRAILKEVLDAERLLDLQYTPFGGHSVVRRAVADALRASHGLPFDFEDVILTPGATAALHVALRAAAAPGDEVVIPVPCWLDYPLYVRSLGLSPVLVPLSEGEFQLDVEAIADAITPRTSAVLLSHPSNPTGRNYDSAAVAALGEALERAAERHGRLLTLIADEVHRDFVPAGAYHSAVHAWPATLVVYSFGKYHFLQGQRIGYLAVSPRHPRRADTVTELVRWARIAGFCAPTTLMQRAVPKLLALRHDLGWLNPWRERFTRELSAAGYSVVPDSATLFLYLATPGARDDFDFVLELATAGVLALPAPIFHHRGYFRLSLTGSERMLVEALPTLRKVAAKCASFA